MGGSWGAWAAHRPKTCDKCGQLVSCGSGACPDCMTPCERAQEIMDSRAMQDTNARRAARVLLCVAPSYDDDTVRQGVADVLSDLRHLCDAAGWSWAMIDREAQRNYSREVAELGTAQDAQLAETLRREG